MATKHAAKAKGISDAQKSSADDQIREMQKEVNYDLRDFTIEHIVDKFRKEEFYIPEYQRLYVWPEKIRVKFIESVFLGLPIPFMFFADNRDGRLEIVDGAQRIQTLESFLNNDLKLAGLRRLTQLNGFKFDDVPVFQRRKFVNRPLRMIILEESTSFEIRHEIFERINTGSFKAKGSEIRRGAFAGPFQGFIQECAANALFQELCPISATMRARREDEELVLRFFTYSDRYKLFRHDVEVFLSNYARDKRSSFDRAKLSGEFQRMLHFVRDHFPHGFAKTRGAAITPRVRFEAIAVGVNLALRKKPDLIPGAIEGWLTSTEFEKETTTHASNSGPRLRSRIEFVRDRLLRGAS